MHKTLILLAGYPGTGKTFLAKQIKKEYPTIQLLSPDYIKENNWDQYGFENIEEKELLIKKSWIDYYKSMEKQFQSYTSIISDYPFSDKQKNQIKELTEKYDYQVITIRLVADLHILFERQLKRDLDDDRHLGHILNRYYKDINIPHDEADNLLDYNEFILRCTTRGYESFSLGKLFELDVTDYTKVDFDQLLKEIEKFL